MKTFKLFSIAALMMITIPSFAQQEANVWSAIKSMQDAFYTFDAQAFAGNFTDDGILVSPMGQIMRGQSIIEKAHKPLFKMWGAPPADVKYSLGNKSCTFIKDDLALVTYTLTSQNGGATGNGQTTFSGLVKNENGKWKVHHLQLTRVQAVPNNG